VIEVAIEALRDTGLIREVSQVAVTVGRSVNIQVFPQESDGFYNVKLSRINLEREYRAMLNVREVIPEAVPEAVSLRPKGDLSALITRGVPFKCIRECSPSLTDFVWRYHAIQLTSQPFAHSPSMRHRDAIANMLGSDALKELRAPISAWLASNDCDFLDGLPAARQHGDFVTSNLAATGDGYVIFDWEDFGEVWLPGFDVCTFMLEATGALDGNGLAPLFRSGDSAIAMLRGRLLEGFGLQERNFPHLLLASLTGFLYLKAEMQYGAPIIEKTKALIAEMLELVGGDGR
jgi:hypothetical protein